MRARHAVVVLGAALALATAAAYMVSPPPYLVGAYYYGWYDDEHWGRFGHAGRHLPEPLGPSLGEYNSGDPRVVDAHARWASEYGIDFFILSWAGQDHPSDEYLRSTVLPALTESGVRQAPMIEILSYQSAELSNVRLRDRLAADVLYLGEHYLQHPSAMRVGDRPLLFLYVSRDLRGDVAPWIAEVRSFLGAIDIDPFIVADEVFWDEPDLERLRAYDAVTAYNVYDWRQTGHRGWADDSSFFTDVGALFSRWREAAAEADTILVPNIMPGYNDRGVRLEEGHFVLPRQTSATGPVTGFLEQSIELALEYVDPSLRMVTITSFNEWHEWTQIEPAVRTGAAPPEEDADVYTEGFPHPAYRFEYLEVIRDRLGD